MYVIHNTHLFQIIYYNKTFIINNIATYNKQILVIILHDYSYTQYNYFLRSLHIGLVELFN